MSPIKYKKNKDRIISLVLDDPESTVNTFNKRFTLRLGEVVDKLESDKSDFDGVILTSAKKTFFAGAELKEVSNRKKNDGTLVFREIEEIKSHFRRLEKLGKPIVSIINGAALGGGFELALATHCRICINNNKIKLGFPEVTLGLLPGAGGVTKLVRVLGIKTSFPLLVEGKLLNPEQMAEIGLIQGLAANLGDAEKMAHQWIMNNPSPLQPWDQKEWTIPGGEDVVDLIRIAPAMINKKARGLYPAPEKILQTMVEGSQVDFETAMRIESKQVAKLAVDPVSKNMIKAFFLDLSAIRSGAGRPKKFPTWRAKKVGIIGAGMMGAGIAWANASRGIKCTLLDVSLEKASKGKSYTESLIKKQSRNSDILDLISTTDTYDDLGDVDLIIEAVFENREVKANVIKKAQSKISSEGFFASNTSTLPISGLAKESPNPEKFIGLHFFSPVDKMRLVEIIKGNKTDNKTIAKAYDYVLSIGKTPIVVNDSRGFYTSRTFQTFVLEGCVMLSEGIPAIIIENSAKMVGMPVGPLEVLDQTSLSLSYDVIKQTKIDLKTEGGIYQQNPGEEVIIEMVEKFNRKGRSAGAGFYEYQKDGSKNLWGGLKDNFGQENINYDFEELKDRFLIRQSLETARCLEEGVLANVCDGNIGSIYGIGFPSWTGGALQYINYVGSKKYLEKALFLSEKYGDRFSPPKFIEDLAKENQILK